MKANELKKISVKLDTIFTDIVAANTSNAFKIHYPHFIFVADNIRLELINLGYKVYIGDWDGIMKNALIIEW